MGQSVCFKLVVEKTICPECSSLFLHKLSNALKTLSGTGRTVLERRDHAFFVIYYCLKALSRFLRSSKYIPMKYLKGGMQVDIQDLVASHQEIVSNPAQ